MQNMEMWKLKGTLLKRNLFSVTGICKRKHLTNAFFLKGEKSSPPSTFQPLKRRGSLPQKVVGIVTGGDEGEYEWVFFQFHLMECDPKSKAVPYW